MKYAKNPFDDLLFLVPLIHAEDPFFKNIPEEIAAEEDPDVYYDGVGPRDVPLLTMLMSTALLTIGLVH